MRQLLAVALVASVVAIPSVAQHGGGGHAGGGGFHGGGGGFQGGGFSSHGGGVRVGGAAGGFARPMNRAGSGYAQRPLERGEGFEGRRGWGPGMADRRPEFYHRDGERRRGYGGVYGYDAGLGYGEYGWLDANAAGDDSGYDPGYTDGYDPGPGYGGAYDAQPMPDVPFVAEGEDAGRGDGAAWQPAPVVRAPVDERDAVTLMFKDGRAPETIRNYALTRTTLYVTDGRRREIPVGDLDLAATKKANQAAGVAFQLPVLP